MEPVLRVLCLQSTRSFHNTRWPWWRRENVSVLSCCAWHSWAHYEWMNEWMNAAWLAASEHSLTSAYNPKEWFYHWEFSHSGKRCGIHVGVWRDVLGRTLSVKTLFMERNVLLLPFPAPADRLLDSFRRWRDCATVWCLQQLTGLSSPSFPCKDNRSLRAGSQGPSLRIWLCPPLPDLFIKVKCG